MTENITTASPDAQQEPPTPADPDRADGDGTDEDAAETSGETAGSPPGGLRHSWRAWIWPATVIATIGGLIALPLLGMMDAPGPPMEEGFMLVFPERVLAGDIPNRDFLHLYGPGSLWVLAGAFKILGAHLWVERLIAIGQLTALIGGVTYLGYRKGPWVAICCGVPATLIILPPIGLTALAWVGGVAFGLWAVILVAKALDPGDQPAKARRRRLAAGGVLAGIALLYRPDLILAVGLALGIVWLKALDRPQRRPLLAGALVGVSPYLAHLVLAGPVNAVRGLVIEPVFDLRPGRSLGFPPPWDSYDSFLAKAYSLHDFTFGPSLLSLPKQTFFWVPLLFLACGVILWAGIAARRAGSPEQWRLLALALFCLGMLPQALQRPDNTHLAWVSAVPFGLVPLAIAELRSLAGQREPKQRQPWQQWLWKLAPATPLLVVLLIIPDFTLRLYADYVSQSFTDRRHTATIEYRGRSFPHGRDGAVEATEALLADADRLSDPGDRLIVGPGSFAFTPYSEVHLYYLLPELEPATYYIEMDPGVANADDSGLADELRNTDIVILSTVYDDWDEPNESRTPGSPEPDQVLAEEFCLYERYGTNPGHEGRGMYELYLRGDRCEQSL